MSAATDGTVAAAIVAALEAEGVGAAFGMDDPQPVFGALRDSSIRTVIVPDERAGVMAADGYARASGGVAVCAGMTGPGATNLATGLLEAYAASVPLVAIVGEATGPGPNRPAFQQAPHDRILGPMVDDVLRIGAADEAAAVTALAVRRAGSGRPRPVLLLVDEDLLWEPAPEPADRAPPPSPAVPDGSDDGLDAVCAEVRALLRSAERPTIVAGGGAQTAGAGAELLRLAEEYAIPVATTLLGKGTIPETHELCAGVISSYTSAEGAGQVVYEQLVASDAIVVVGSDLDSVTTVDGAWPADGTRLVRIDVDERELLARPALNLVGDARRMLGILLDRDDSKPTDGELSERRRHAAELGERLERARGESRRRAQGRAAAGAVEPEAVVAEIDRGLEPGDALVTDASYSSAWALAGVRAGWTGRAVLAPRGTGVLGWGLPAAIGAKLARPEGRVVCLTGDGGFHYHLSCLELAARYDLGLVVVVLNNGSLGFQRHSDMAQQGEDFADLSFAPVDYSQLARAFGWLSRRVETIEDFGGWLAELRELPGERALVEVMVSRDRRPPIASPTEH